MAATIQSTGQWTKLFTDLTPLLDVNKPFPGGLPALNPQDLNTSTIPGGIPYEIYEFIVEASKGLPRSQFEGTDVATGTTNLNILATAILMRQFLTFYIERGFPGHDGVGTRG